MAVSDKLIIEPEDLKPRLPVKKGALLGAILAVMGAGFVITVLTTSGGAEQSKAPDVVPTSEKSASARPETGMARAIDEEINEARLAVAREERERGVAPGVGATVSATIPDAVRRTDQTAALYGKEGGAGNPVIPGARQANVGGGATSSYMQAGPSERELQIDAQAVNSNALAYDADMKEGSGSLGGLIRTGADAMGLNGRPDGEAGGVYKSPEVRAASESVKSPFSMFAAGGMGGGGFGGSGGQGRGPGGGGASEESWVQRVAGATHGTPLRSYPTQSRFTLHQGKVLPAVLGRDINTDLPGAMTAYTTIDIYDSLGNGHMLIPKGSVLIGEFNSDVKVGQARVNFAFKRLVMPDGRSFDLPAAQASDMGGASGLEGDVNNHFFTMFASSFAIAWMADRLNASQPTNVTVIGGGSTPTSPAGQVLIDVSKTILERNKRMAPTITVPKGTRLNVEVVQDMEFPGPYRRSQE